MNPTNPCRGHAAESERAEGIEAAVRELRLFIMGESLQTRKEASKHLEALVAECDRLTNIIANPMMHGMTIRDGALEMSLEGPGPALLAGMFIGLLDRFPDAQNYVECSFSSALGPITVTVQKPGGKTPHALRVEAETELAASKAECARLSSMLDHQRDESTETERMLRSELEAERIRLAACGVVALSNTPESAAKARDMRPEYRSASCDDVARMVDEQMHLRASLTNSQNRLFDVLVGDDGQAWKEAERYLERERPDLYGALNQRAPRGAVPEGWFPCGIAEADFGANTVTLDMKCSNYRILAGSYYLVPADAAVADVLKQPDSRHELQAQGTHPAPCARHCEATAFQIEIRNLRSQAKHSMDCAEAFKAEAGNLRRVLASLVDDIDGLIGDSTGVYGLHQNGDPSPWNELLAGGRFQRLDLGEARAAVDRLAPATPAEILDDAQRLIERAQHAGVVLTIETVSIPPWAMGRYAMRAATRPARHATEQKA